MDRASGCLGQGKVVGSKLNESFGTEQGGWKHSIRYFVLHFSGKFHQSVSTWTDGKSMNVYAVRSGPYTGNPGPYTGPSTGPPYPQ